MEALNIGNGRNYFYGDMFYERYFNTLPIEYRELYLYFLSHSVGGFFKPEDAIFQYNKNMNPIKKITLKSTFKTLNRIRPLIRTINDEYWMLEDFWRICQDKTNLSMSNSGQHSPVRRQCKKLSVNPLTIAGLDTMNLDVKEYLKEGLSKPLVMDNNNTNTYNNSTSNSNDYKTNTSDSLNKNQSISNNIYNKESVEINESQAVSPKDKGEGYSLNNISDDNLPF